MFFHYISRGGCKVRLADNPATVEARAGGLLLFAHDDTHLLGNDLQLAPLESESVPESFSPGTDLMELYHGGGGATTHFVCGYPACNRSVSRRLLDALPRFLRIPLGEGTAASAVRELLRMGVRESAGAQPGGATTLTRLSDLLFVEAMRAYIASLPPGRNGWLAGLRDAQVGRALALLHGEPRRIWTVDELAREVALSRSALAERFAALVGEPPMQYLTRWRLALAAQALRSGAEAITRVAERSGYEPEAAFSRAFKREFGMPPAAWRRAAAT